MSRLTTDSPLPVRFRLGDVKMDTVETVIQQRATAAASEITTSDGRPYRAASAVIHQPFQSQALKSRPNSGLQVNHVPVVKQRLVFSASSNGRVYTAAMGSRTDAESDNATSALKTAAIRRPHSAAADIDRYLSGTSNPPLTDNSDGEIPTNNPVVKRRRELLQKTIAESDPVNYLERHNNMRSTLPLKSLAIVLESRTTDGDAQCQLEIAAKDGTHEKSISARQLQSQLGSSSQQQHARLVSSAGTQNQFSRNKAIKTMVVPIDSIDPTVFSDEESLRKNAEMGARIFAGDLPPSSPSRNSRRANSGRSTPLSCFVFKPTSAYLRSNAKHSISSIDRNEEISDNIGSRRRKVLSEGQANAAEAFDALEDFNTAKRMASALAFVPPEQMDQQPYLRYLRASSARTLIEHGGNVTPLGTAETLTVGMELKNRKPSANLPRPPMSGTAASRPPRSAHGSASTNSVAGAPTKELLYSEIPEDTIGPKDDEEIDPFDMAFQTIATIRGYNQDQPLGSGVDPSKPYSNLLPAEAQILSEWDRQVDIMTGGRGIAAFSPQLGTGGSDVDSNISGKPGASSSFTEQDLKKLFHQFIAKRGLTNWGADDGVANRFSSAKVPHSRPNSSKLTTPREGTTAPNTLIKSPRRSASVTRSKVDSQASTSDSLSIMPMITSSSSKGKKTTATSKKHSSDEKNSRSSHDIPVELSGSVVQDTQEGPPVRELLSQQEEQVTQRSTSAMDELPPPSSSAMGFVDEQHPNNSEPLVKEQTTVQMPLKRSSDRPHLDAIHHPQRVEFSSAETQPKVFYKEGDKKLFLANLINRQERNTQSRADIISEFKKNRQQEKLGAIGLSVNGKSATPPSVDSSAVSNLKAVSGLTKQLTVEELSPAEASALYQKLSLVEPSPIERVLSSPKRIENENKKIQQQLDAADTLNRKHLKQMERIGVERWRIESANQTRQVGLGNRYNTTNMPHPVDSRRTTLDRDPPLLEVPCRRILPSAAISLGKPRRV